MHCMHAPYGCPFETDVYNPYISLPSEIRDLDSAWQDCSINPLAGSWDPPYALQPVSGPLTIADPPRTQGPAAGATPTSPQAQSTLNPSQPRPWKPSASSVVSSTYTVDLDTHTALASGNIIKPTNPVPLLGPSNIPADPSRIFSLGPASAITPQDNPLTTLVPVITVQGIPLTANSASAYVAGLQTLKPGGPAITISGAVISLAPSATALVVAGTTIPIPRLTSPLDSQLTVGPSAYTVNSASGFVIGSQTLTPGDQVPVSGTVYSIPPGSTAVTVTGSIIPVPLKASALVTPSNAFMFGSSVYTENSASNFIIGSQTLTPGGKITVSGTIISLGPVNTDVVIGETITEGLGAIIMSGFGHIGVPTPTGTTTKINEFTGLATGQVPKIVWIMVSVAVSVVLVT